MTTTGNQKSFPLAFGGVRVLPDVPERLLRQIESEAQALAVSISAGNHKLEYIGACIGKSKAYVSRMQSGQRPIPAKLVAPLCSATGSNLLAQYREREAALAEFCSRREISRLADMLRAAA